MILMTNENFEQKTHFFSIFYFICSLTKIINQSISLLLLSIKIGYYQSKYVSFLHKNK